MKSKFKIGQKVYCHIYQQDEDKKKFGGGTWLIRKGYIQEIINNDCQNVLADYVFIIEDVDRQHIYYLQEYNLQEIIAKN